MLDRQIGDASPGIQLIRPYDGLGRANLDTPSARPAMVSRFCMGGSKRDVGHQLAKEVIRPFVAPNVQRVFANPAQPRLLSEPFFEKGSAVSDRSGGKGVMPVVHQPLIHLLPQALEPCSNDLW